MISVAVQGQTKNRFDSLFNQADSAFNKESYVVKWMMLTEIPPTNGNPNRAWTWDGPRVPLSKKFKNKQNAIKYAIQLTKWNIYKEVKIYRINKNQ